MKHMVDKEFEKNELQKTKAKRDLFRCRDSIGCEDTIKFIN